MQLTEPTITTAAVLTAAEIKLCREGFRHMVDNGYGKINDMRDMLRSIAADIEYAQKEIFTEKLYGRDVTDMEFRLNCERHGFSNLASRAGITA